MGARGELFLKLGARVSVPLADLGERMTTRIMVFTATIDSQGSLGQKYNSPGPLDQKWHEIRK